MLIPTDGRLPQTSQTAAIGLDRIAARSIGPGVGEERWSRKASTNVSEGVRAPFAEGLALGVTPVQVVFIGDGTSSKSLS
jgi:hypothetical protein